MRIINVLEIINGIPSGINSFPIYEEQLTEEVVKEAEDFFIKCIEENSEKLEDEDKEIYLDNGNFSDINGYEIYLIWSEIN